MPAGLSVTPSGGLVVSDAMTCELDFFDSDLTHADGMTGFFPSPPVNCVFLSDTTFVGMKPDYEMEGDMIRAGFMVALWSTDSVDPRTVYFRELKPFNPMDLSGSADGLPIFTASMDGRVYTSLISTSEFTCHGWNPDGSALFTISEPYEAVPKTMEQIEREREFLNEMMLQAGAADGMMDLVEPEPFHYAVSSLGIDPSGNLWVGLGYYSRPVFRVYDSNTGHYLFTAALDADRSLSVLMNQWGFSALDRMSDRWPMVYLLELDDQR